MTVTTFDHENIRRFHEPGKDFLQGFVPELIRLAEIESAWDVGCGFSFSARNLAALGVPVTALAGRPIVREWLDGPAIEPDEDGSKDRRNRSMLDHEKPAMTLRAGKYGCRLRSCVVRPAGEG